MLRTTSRRRPRPPPPHRSPSREVTAPPHPIGLWEGPQGPQRPRPRPHPSPLHPPPGPSPTSIFIPRRGEPIKTLRSITCCPGGGRGRAGPRAGLYLQSRPRPLPSPPPETRGRSRSLNRYIQRGAGLMYSGGGALGEGGARGIVGNAPFPPLPPPVRQSGSPVHAGKEGRGRGALLA